MAARPDFASLLGSVDARTRRPFASYLRDGLRGADLSLLIPPDGVPYAPGSEVDLDCMLRAARFLQGLPTRPDRHR